MSLDYEELERAIGRPLESVFEHTFISPNALDANGEPANIVDGLYVLASAIRYAADEHKQALGAIAQAIYETKDN